MSYRSDYSALLSPSERQLFRKLSTPGKIQDYLDSLPINLELDGETYFSPRRTIREGVAHCFEGALMAAAALAWHGHEPLLLDLKTAAPDVDHVVALFRQGGCWGAISKTNHAVLRWRDPVYRTPRELALSYFHEYFLPDGRKTLRSYSRPFALTRYEPARWVVAEEDLTWLMHALDRSRHEPIVAPREARSLRRACALEIKASDMQEWPAPSARPTDSSSG